MRLDNPSFTAVNLSRVKQPLFVVALSFDRDNADVVYLRSSIAAKIPAGAQTIAAEIQSISGQSQKINPDIANASIGGLNIKIVDVDNSLTELIYNRLDEGNGLREKRLEVYVGYDGLNWESYEKRNVYIIDGYQVSNGTYTFQASDVQRLVRQQVFEPDTTNLRTSIGATDMFIPITDQLANKFQTIEHDLSYTDAPLQTVGYVSIGEKQKCEIISHNGVIDHPVHGWCLEVVERGALHTKARAVKVEATVTEDRRPKITEYIYLEGPAPKLTYAVLTGKLFGQPGQSLPKHWNLDLSAEYVRLADFVNIGEDLWDVSNVTGRHVRFDGLSKTDGKRFIEKELLLWIGAYMPVYGDGSLGLRRLTPVLSNSDHIAVLNDANVVSCGTLKHDLTKVTNHFVVDWHWDHIEQRYLKREIFIDGTSTARHQIAPARKIQFRGVHANNHTQDDLFSAFDTIRDRYSGPPLLLSLSVLPSLNILEVGDTIRVKIDQIRDASSGTSLDRVFEVQQVSTDWTTGNVKLALFGSSQRAGAIQRVELPSVLPTSFYSAIGTDLASFPQVADGALIGNLELTGTDSNQDTASIFYMLGDFTINEGIRLIINQNIQLRIMGRLIINGGLDGFGRGTPGAPGGSVFSQNGLASISVAETSASTFPADNAQLGTVQYLGGSLAAGGVLFKEKTPAKDTLISDIPPLAQTNALSAVPSYQLSVDGDLLTGIPANLRGSAGSGGRASGTLIDANWQIAGSGGAGGAGGAGLYIVCQGLSFGASGNINLSGADGAVSEPMIDDPFFASGIPSWYGGSGGGGAPGAMCVVIDGNGSVPVTKNYVINKQGLCPLPVGSLDFVKITDPPLTVGDIPKTWYSSHTGKVNHNFGDAGIYFTYAPQQRIVQDEVSPIASDPDDMILNVIPNSPQTIAQNQSTIEITVVPPVGTVIKPTNYAYSMIYYRELGATAWQLLGPADDEQVLVVPSVAKEYEFEARGVTLDGDEADAGIIRSIAVTDVVSPFLSPAAVTGVIASSGSAHLLKAANGAIHSRILLSWNASPNVTVRRYEVQYKLLADTDYISAGIVDSTTLYIMPVSDGSMYEIRIRPITVTNTEGAWATTTHRVVGKTEVPSDVVNFEVINDSFALLMSWDAIPDVDLREYEVRQGDNWALGTLVAKLRSTNLRLDIKKAGIYSFMVRAWDTSNNISNNVTFATIEINPPNNLIMSAPQFNDEIVTLNWHFNPSPQVPSYPIEEYEIRQGDVMQSFDEAVFVSRVKSTSFSKKVDWSNTRFWVQAIDIAGNLSPPASIDIPINTYKEVTIKPEVIDNNVLLHWSLPESNKGTLPIGHYLIQKQFKGNTIDIGSTTGTFQQVFEQEPGIFTYLVTAVDTAGNPGLVSSKDVYVDEPPDYVLHKDWNSEFDGIASNARLTRRGTLLLPVNTKQTYAQHFADNGWSTPQSKLDSGHSHYAHPSMSTAGYIEDFDYGQVLPSTLVRIVPRLNSISGTVEMNSTIRVRKLTTDPWTEYPGVSQAIVHDFQYIQIQLDFSATGTVNLLELQQLEVKLSKKLQKDSGKATITDAANGLVIPFNKSFLDIQHLEVTAPNANSSDPTKLRLGIFDFVDVPSPTEFTAYIINQQTGEKLTGTIYWSASGV